MTTKPIRATGRKDQNSEIAGNTMPTIPCNFKLEVRNHNDARIVAR